MLTRNNGLNANSDDGFYYSVKKFLGKPLVLAAGALLAACTGETSDDIAQEDSLEISLAQCEVAQGGVIGTPADPVVVNGVETQACLLNTDMGQVSDVVLKQSHNYQPLVWVLDGNYEIGQSKSYGTLAELQEDSLYRVEAKAPIYARDGAVVVVHRNGRLVADIAAVDEDLGGGGEWGGVVVNSIGYHPDCGANASADNFCNIEGEWGFFGGLSQKESRYPEGGGVVLTDNSEIQRRPVRTGFIGSVAEAGGEPLSAAVILNAPHYGQTYSPTGVFYSAKTGLEINGGSLALQLSAMGNRGHAIHWYSDYSGVIGNGSIVYHEGELPALYGEGGGSGEYGVELKKLTLVDKSLSADRAIALGGGGDIAIDNVVVQGFSTCLGIADGETRASVTSSVFYCDQTTAAADDGTDHAAEVLSQAENFYTLNPDLEPQLAISGSRIQGIDAGATLPSGSQGLASRYPLSLVYESCYGVGTPLEETVDIGTGSYGICELKGQVSGNLYFDDDINGELVAWRINGAVAFGSDFSSLDAAQQQAALAEPRKVVLDSDSIILLDAGSALAFNADVALTVLGTEEDPVKLEPQDPQESWGGIAVKGLADDCTGEEICALAQGQFTDIRYLRLLKAGNGRPALALEQVSAAGQVNHLDIADSASVGLALNGGAANIDNLLVSNATGNQVQWSNGYRGTLQYAILQSGDRGLGHAIHGRNNAADHDASPRSRPVMANITVKGVEQADTAILLEQGSGLLLYNSVVADFNTCLDVDDQSTADLQHTDPAQIYFDNVVLDCGETVPAEDENSGLDFAASTQGLSGVYEVAAVLDSNFVATGPDIPAIESEIDFSLAGSSANNLNAGVDYMGSVRDSLDDWYLGWSDSVGVLLAEACDFKGVLEDDYVYQNQDVQVTVDSQTYYSNYKVCGLRGTITEDFMLTAYTGEDAAAVASGLMITEELYPGHTVEREPMPTLWLINGLVRIGEGHLELTDPAMVEAMKADPVTLGIEASSVVMVSEGGGLHITRGGELVVVGGKSLAGGNDTDTSGPVNLIGLIDQTQLPSSQLSPGNPVNVKVRNWTGVIVDGFARNNRCPDAMAEPGSRVCNIQSEFGSEFGYYGGYDDSHNNLWVENLHMLKGSLRLNSVGRGGKFENFYFGLGAGLVQELGAWGEDNFGRAIIDIDGGRVNLHNINIARVGPGSAIRWNHGYQGTMQSVHINGVGFAGAISSDDPAFFDTLYQDQGGNWQYYPVIRGANGESGHENDLPRSMPTLANFTLYAADLLNFSFSNPVDVGSTAIDLSFGSGLYMYNSIVGSRKFDFDNAAFGTSTVADQCISADPSVAALLGGELILNQVAFGCRALSKDLNLATKINDTFTSETFVNVPGVSNSGTIKIPSLANKDIYHFDWVVGSGGPDNHSNNVPEIEVFRNWNIAYPSINVINLGNVPMDYSASPSVDMEFIVDTSYFGTLDYFLPIDAREEIRAD